MGVLRAPIQVDGAYGEGGGALVRAALVMSSLTQQAVRIENVRGGSKFPGFDFEDLILLKALAKSCSAQTTGGEVGSNTVTFSPSRRPKGLKESLDIADSGGRGASAPVVLCALLPVFARSGMYSSVSLSGETFGSRTLSCDYLQNVTIPAHQRMGLYAFVEQEVAGFGRESRGRLTMDVEPSALQSIDWTSRGRLMGCHAVVTTSNLQPAVTRRAIGHLTSLARHASVPIEIEDNPVDSESSGAFVTLWAVFERGMGGATGMGRRGLKIETLVQGAFEEFVDWLSGDATVDPFLADQLLVTACLADGETTFKVSELTSRFLTSVWVIKQFLPIHITVRGAEGQPGVVVIKR